MKFYDMLLDIAKRPHLYVGENNLLMVSHLIGGYTMCANDKGDQVPWQFMHGFQEYVQERYHEQRTLGWWNIIEMNCPDSETPTELFGQLIRSYKEERAIGDC